MTPQMEIQLIAIIMSVACALPGVFLVLRKMALISDAISHSILLGIVLGFFITKDLNSPILILMAGLVGVLTVILVEIIQKTKLVKEDTAIGLVFPALFSIGVILISLEAADVHLDIDSVLVGELVFAPFNRWYFNGIDLGPKSLWIMGSILLITIVLLILFYKELKITTFDPGLSLALGISPLVMHYGLATVSSITIVGAFDAVGAILVVAMMIVPAATSYLLVNNLKKMLILSSLFGVFAAVSGFWTAIILDVSISGAIVTVLGIVFLSVYVFAPRKGVVSDLFYRQKQKMEVKTTAFLLHLYSLNRITNENENKEERSIEHLYSHFQWSGRTAEKMIKHTVKKELIEVNNRFIYLTEKGEKYSRDKIDFI